MDVPNFFWDSEPTLHPLFAAIREYLEIDLRIKVLNERCRVFLDLAEILSDSVADSKMSAITWIIIVLIVISILVTTTEVILRFAMLERSKNSDEPSKAAKSAITWSHDLRSGSEIVMVPPSLSQQSRSDSDDSILGLSDLEIVARTLGLQTNATLEDIQQGIRDLKSDPK